MKEKCKQNAGTLKGKALEDFLKNIIIFGESEPFEGYERKWIFYFYKKDGNTKGNCKGPITQGPSPTSSS